MEVKENTNVETELSEEQVEMQSNTIEIENETQNNSKELSATDKVLTLIEQKLINKTEDEIKNMSSSEIDNILGVKTSAALNTQAKLSKMGKVKTQEMKRDFVLLLKKSIEGDHKSGELKKELSDIEAQFKSEMDKSKKEIDIPEIIVDLCQSSKYQNMDDKDADFKLYVRGLKMAGTLENMEHMLNKYKFKTLYNLFTKSFDVSKDRVFKILSDHKMETFNDPRIITPVLNQLFKDEYYDDTLNIFSFIFYMLFDDVKNDKIRLDLTVFAKYFLLQIYYIVSNNTFKSRELFITSSKRLLDQIQTSLIKENYINIEKDQFKKDVKEISELKEEDPE